MHLVSMIIDRFHCSDLDLGLAKSSEFKPCALSPPPIKRGVLLLLHGSEMCLMGTRDQGGGSARARLGGLLGLLITACFVNVNFGVQTNEINKSHLCSKRDLGVHTAHWLGDNAASAQDSIPGILNFQMFGIPLGWS